MLEHCIDYTVWQGFRFRCSGNGLKLAWVNLSFGVLSYLEGYRVWELVCDATRFLRCFLSIHCSFILWPYHSYSLHCSTPSREEEHAALSVFSVTSQSLIWDRETLRWSKSERENGWRVGSRQASSDFEASGKDFGEKSFLAEKSDKLHLWR